MLKIKLAASKMNCVVNLGFTLCLQLEIKYSIVLNPNSRGILVYKLYTSKVTKTVSSVTFRLHVFNNSILSSMLLLACLDGGFKIKSKQLLKITLVEHFGTPTIGLSFKSLGSKMVISSLFCSLIALCKVSDLCILGWP